jgi:hypothetical protein
MGRWEALAVIPAGESSEWFSQGGLQSALFFGTKPLSDKSEPPVGVPAARAWGWRALLKFEEEATITNKLILPWGRWDVDRSVGPIRGVLLRKTQSTRVLEPANAKELIPNIR